MKIAKYVEYSLLTKLTKQDKKLFKKEFTYKKAINYFVNDQYDLALDLFKTIESYEDSKVYMMVCNSKIESKVKQSLDVQYQKACNLMSLDQYQEAIKIFKTMIDYKQSKIFLDYCEDKLKDQTQNKQLHAYHLGITYFQKKQFALAMNSFKQANHYEDSDFYINLCEKEIKEQEANVSKNKVMSAQEYYQEAKKLYNVKDYVQAIKMFEKADELGSVDASYYLGYMYEMGFGVTNDKNKAISYYLKAANKNDRISIDALARLYYGSKDYKNALKWYLKNAESNSYTAAYKVGAMYEKGEGTIKNIDEARKWYQKAANQGYQEAKDALKRLNSSNQNKEMTAQDYFKEAKKLYDKQDYVQAKPLFEKADELGNMQACNYLGFIYRFGKGVEVNYNKAKSYYLKGANNNDKESIYTLAALYYFDLHDYENALRWYIKDAESGSYVSAYKVGTMYEKGEGTNKNMNEAIKWYQKAADSGDQDAINALKRLNSINENKEMTAQEYYKEAEILYAKKDYGLAKKLFEKADELGNVEASYMLGKMYEDGSGVTIDYHVAKSYYLKAVNNNHRYSIFKLAALFYFHFKDYKIALKWYIKDAELGSSYSAYKVGTMYEKGEGTNKNITEALKWYQKAANQGYQNAKDALNRLNSSNEDKVNVKKSRKELANDYYNKAIPLYKNKKYQEALPYFEQAANYGHDNAANVLGIMYYHGYGVKKDLRKAKKYYLDAAILNNITACKNLALLYKEENNMEEFYRWSNKAKELEKK